MGAFVFIGLTQYTIFLLFVLPYLKIISRKKMDKVHLSRFDNFLMII